MLIALASSVLIGCPKKPTPAQAAATLYGEMAVKHRTLAADSTLDGKVPDMKVADGEPVDGVYEVCGEMSGHLDWARAAIGAPEAALPEGDLLETVFVDICMAQESGGCSRPNSYTLKAIMRKDGQAWKVAGSSCAPKEIVR